jgi:hypothetical protein
MNGLPEPSAVACIYPTLAPRLALTTAARHDARLCPLGSSSAPLRDINRTVEMPLAHRTVYGESGPGNAIAHAGASWLGTSPGTRTTSFAYHDSLSLYIDSGNLPTNGYDDVCCTDACAYDSFLASRTPRNLQLHTIGAQPHRLATKLPKLLTVRGILAHS